MKEPEKAQKKHAIERFETALLVAGFVLFVGGLIAAYQGKRSADITAGSDAILGYTQYGMYPGQIIAVIGIVAAIIGAVSLIVYAITRYVGRGQRPS